MRTPALIFDFGNVVAFFDYTRAAERIGRRIGVPGSALLARLRDQGLNPLVRQYESGRMTAEAFGAAVSSLAGVSLRHDDFAAAWSDIFWINQPTVDLVAFLKGRGYTLLLGSNTNDLHAAQFRRQFADALAPFDRLVLSFEVGHCKPDPEFYLACAEATGAAPADCVFIDDLPENVAGACDAGLHGLLYRDHPTLLADLRGLGVEVPPA